MRADVISKEKFDPKNLNHYFESEETFSKFIEEIDPMDFFNPEKRIIKWVPIERRCQNCGDVFLATHPATRFCEAHRNNAASDGDDE